MHNCKTPLELSLRPHRHRRRSAFSLIEVSMALAIVAIAFVALIGLLPAGMKVFEAAANTTAETRMVAHLSSLLQAADYTKFRAQSTAGVYYYYDVDGSYIDSSKDPVQGSENKRIYAAKMLVENQNVPSDTLTYDQSKTASRVLIFMARNDPFVMKTMDSINAPSAIPSILKGNNRVKVQPIVVARMDIE